MKSDDTQRDDLFSIPQQQVVDFAFNAAVADVFPDMLRRSVPGYETIISQLGVFARKYVQPDSRVYDLGCSLGAATLAVAAQARQENVKFICVDNSEAMTRRCEQRLARHLSPETFELICEDICTLPMHSASMVVLNFTLQFVSPELRQALISNIYDALLPGGVLILSEKVCFADDEQQALINDLYMEFKRANGYSEMEISQKRTALENVMIPDTESTHFQRLNTAGFEQNVTWFKSFSFMSMMAVKRR